MSSPACADSRLHMRWLICYVRQTINDIAQPLMVRDDHVICIAPMRSAMEERFLRSSSDCGKVLMIRTNQFEAAREWCSHALRSNAASIA